MLIPTPAEKVYLLEPAGPVAVWGLCSRCKEPTRVTKASPRSAQGQLLCARSCAPAQAAAS